MTLFVRLTHVSPESKAEDLKRTIKSLAANGKAEPADTFDVDTGDFSALPGAPFAYWLPTHLRHRIRSASPFARDERAALQGLITGDDPRFVRAWWEVTATESESDAEQRKWVPFTKGGKRSHLYADIPTVVRYDRVGQVGIAMVGRYGRGATHYYRPGLSWPLRGVRFSSYAVPSGCIFSVGGKMAFAPVRQLLPALGLFNGAAFNAFLMVRAGKVGGVQYEAGLIQQAPIPDLDSPECCELGKLAKKGWELRYLADSINETSHAFALPLGLRERLGEFGYSELLRHSTQIEAEIDRLSYAAYHLGHEDQLALESSADQLAHTDAGAEPEEGEDDVDAVGFDDEATLLSWGVGVAFGRFDIAVATGKRLLSPPPKPFDRLLAKSPGMAAEDQTRRLLVDDEGHPDDLTNSVRQVLQAVGHGEHDGLRTWLARDFFPLHLRMYSKSRRKAPIYWQLATTSASYSIWLYIHAFTKDTFYKVQNDYAAPKLEHEIRRLESLRRELGETPKPADRKVLAAQETFVEELSAFLAEVKRITPLWNPDLDDGVLLNFAPLHRLVPHNKPWQKELKATWDALSAGEYDWAHLAMHLWPERVVPKCAADRSLAIAHGLEDVFWLEDAAGKWKPRTTPTTPVDDLVRERTSPAVKAALASLRDAPTAQGTSKPARRKGTR